MASLPWNLCRRGLRVYDVSPGFSHHFDTKSGSFYVYGIALGLFICFQSIATPICAQISGAGAFRREISLHSATIQIPTGTLTKPRAFRTLSTHIKMKAPLESRQPIATFAAHKFLAQVRFARKITSILQPSRFPRIRWQQFLAHLVRH